MYEVFVESVPLLKSLEVRTLSLSLCMHVCEGGLRFDNALPCFNNQVILNSYIKSVVISILDKFVEPYDYK